MTPPRDKLKTINRAVGKTPTLAGLPSSMMFPLAIAFSITALARTIFGLSFSSCFWLLVWLVATWWIATGGDNYRFLSKFSKAPRWIRATKKYQPLTHEDEPKN